MGEMLSSLLDLNLCSVSSICLSLPLLKNAAIELGSLLWKNFHAMDAACKEFCVSCRLGWCVRCTPDFQLLLGLFFVDLVWVSGDCLEHIQ